MTRHLYVPTGVRVLRAKLQCLRADTRVVPHAHPWGQVALSAAGVVRVTAPHGSYIVPPSRTVWIPPGVEQAVTSARKLPMASIAAELGYASASAFTAMVRRSVGAPPSRFLRP